MFLPASYVFHYIFDFACRAILTRVTLQYMYIWCKNDNILNAKVFLIALFFNNGPTLYFVALHRTRERGAVPIPGIHRPFISRSGGNISAAQVAPAARQPLSKRHASNTTGGWQEKNSTWAGGELFYAFYIKLQPKKFQMKVKNKRLIGVVARVTSFSPSFPVPVRCWVLRKELNSVEESRVG